MNNFEPLGKGLDVKVGRCFVNINCGYILSDNDGYGDDNIDLSIESVDSLISELIHLAIGLNESKQYDSPTLKLALVMIIFIFECDCVTDLVRRSGGLDSPGGKKVLVIESNIRILINKCPKELIKKVSSVARKMSEDLQHSRKLAQEISEKLEYDDKSKRRVMVINEHKNLDSYDKRIEIHKRLKKYPLPDVIIHPSTVDWQFPSGVMTDILMSSDRKTMRAFMRFCIYGNLDKALKQNSSLVHEYSLLNCLYSATLSLYQLHKNGIIHGNISTASFIVDSNFPEESNLHMYLRLTDFSKAEFSDDKKKMDADITQLIQFCNMMIETTIKNNYVSDCIRKELDLAALLLIADVEQDNRPGDRLEKYLTSLEKIIELRKRLYFEQMNIFLPVLHRIIFQYAAISC